MNRHSLKASRHSHKRRRVIVAGCCRPSCSNSSKTSAPRPSRKLGAIHNKFWPMVAANLRRLLRNTGIHPEAIITDKLASYRAVARVLNLHKVHRPGGMQENNRVENSHLVIRRRERKQLRFKSQGSVQRFLSSHGPIYNTFNLQPHSISRSSLRTFRARAEAAWAAATVPA